MRRLRRLTLLLAVGGLAIAAVRHGRGAVTAREEPGGILIGDPGAYDQMSRLLLGPFYRSIAADVAAASASDARVLEVGCGPGHLTIELAGRHGLDVTGLDLDPTMIQRASANAHRTTDAETQQPTFVVGDVAALPFPDKSFDMVVSTLSLHHWADPTAGLAEIGRVLRPGGRALIWDFRPGLPFHRNLPDPIARAQRTALRVMSSAPWRWPWRLSLAQRVELMAPSQ